jgi:hypothetical protein
MRIICLLIGACLGLAACGNSDAEQQRADRTGATNESELAPAATSHYGEVAFTTYQSGGFRIVFLSPSKARKTWANMDGGAVSGQYTQRGKEIEVQWDPAASHHGSLSERFSQTGPCALARYERVDRNNQLHDEEPQIYQQKEPRCDAVRLVQ